MKVGRIDSLLLFDLNEATVFYGAFIRHYQNGEKLYIHRDNPIKENLSLKQQLFINSMLVRYLNEYKATIAMT
jgi:hypothetical protein